MTIRTKPGEECYRMRAAAGASIQEAESGHRLVVHYQVGIVG